MIILVSIIVREKRPQDSIKVRVLEGGEKPGEGGEKRKIFRCVLDSKSFQKGGLPCSPQNDILLRWGEIRNKEEKGRREAHEFGDAQIKITVAP